MKIKKKLMLGVLMISTMISMSAFAGEENAIKARVSIPVTVESNLNNEYICRITPDDANAESYINKTELHFKGSGEREFTCSYKEPGVYSYTVAEDKSDDYTDTTVYNLDVHVSYEGDSLVAEPVVYESSSNEKKEELIFHNGSETEKEDSGVSGSTGSTGSVSSGSRGSLPVKTADNTPVDIFIGMFGTSILMLVILFMSRRKGEYND